jgi:quercetin dioxygenase-like cupin family protein
VAGIVGGPDLGTIRFKERPDVDFTHPSAKSPEIEQGYFFVGSDDEPQMFEVYLPPSYVTEPHAHSRDEVIHVLEGELDFGSRRLTAGDSVSVPADTLYGFRVGPDGVRFLNFRSRGGADYQDKDEFMRRHAARRQLADASSGDGA